jgi:hypothetical protein
MDSQSSCAHTFCKPLIRRLPSSPSNHARQPAAHSKSRTRFKVTEWSAAFEDHHLRGYKRCIQEALMDIDTIGIDLGKAVFHLVGLNMSGEIVCGRNCLASSYSTLRRIAGKTDRHGGLRRCALSQPGTSRSGPRRPSDASPIRQALRQDEQERLERRENDRRGRGATEDALLCRSRVTTSWICSHCTGCVIAGCDGAHP